MLAVSRLTEDEVLQRLGTEVGFLTGVAHWDGQPFRLEPFQRAFLSQRSRYRCTVKSRQVGYSLIFAAEALARCHLRAGHTSIFISYNLDDAKEKIAYARQLHDELPAAFRKRLVVDKKTELAFASNAADGRISRIVSVPSKAPRGKKGDVYLDELAHYINDRQVYRGSTALILRSSGQLTACSSPLGKRGVFWEIADQEIRPYPAFVRQRVPWWLCRYFCTDPTRAVREAPEMTTEERVVEFGTSGVRDQFDSLALEDFQQEFEARFVDEATAFFPYELILPCTDDELVLYEDYQAFPPEIEGRLLAGFDVGRRNDSSELVIVEEVSGVHHVRLIKSFDRRPFAEQEAELARMMDVLPVARLSIDQTGLGMHLAENLGARFGARVRRESFTSPAKEVWAHDFRIHLQQRTVRLPRERDLLAQIHSIRRKLTPAGHPSFEAEVAGERRGGRHHGDKFWALALACQKERFIRRLPNVTLQVLG